MEGHNGFAGAGTTLYDEHAGLRRPNDFVLLGLNRGDDVAERASAAALKRSNQCAVSTELTSWPISGVTQAVVVTDTEMAGTEQLVFDPEQVATFDGEMATTSEPHRLTTGGPIERFGNRCPPVDNDRFGIIGGNRQPTDVVTLEFR